MSNSLQDSDTIIRNYYHDIIDNENITKILSNCKINKTFNKFIKLVITMQISLFDKNTKDIKSHNKILNTCVMKKRELIVNFSTKTMIYSLKENSIELIENDFLKLKQNIENIELIIYMLKNIYIDDKILKEMFIQPKKKIYIDEYHN